MNKVISVSWSAKAECQNRESSKLDRSALVTLMGSFFRRTENQSNRYINGHTHRILTPSEHERYALLTVGDTFHHHPSLPCTSALLPHSVLTNTPVHIIPILQPHIVSDCVTVYWIDQHEYYMMHSSILH